ncbi:MAG: hypothetical protein R2939_06845 [Kofleriaceae bacterium]
MKRRAVVMVVLLLGWCVVGCTRDVHATYPTATAPGAATGSITFAFTGPASGVTIAVNGTLVVDGARTERVTIDGIPAGSTHVVIAAGPSEKAMTVWVDPRQAMTIPVGAGGEAPTSALRGAAVSLLSVVLYALLN